MKPWLLEILACPIDKHYPLNLVIFKIEDETEVMKKIKNKELMIGDLAFFFSNVNEEETVSSKHEIINVEVDNDADLFVHDTLIRKSMLLLDYLKEIHSSIVELQPITDKSNAGIQDALHELLEFKIIVEKKIKILESGNVTVDEKISIIDSLKDKLLLLNWFKQAIEIEEGVMWCTKCNRWYPIRETIPQMLPDELRNENEDIQFLEKWNQFLDEMILKKGVPFHLS
ncbi:MAG: Trm112 family protein [Promethearchaeota archaeon]